MNAYVTKYLDAMHEVKFLLKTASEEIDKNIKEKDFEIDENTIKYLNMIFKDAISVIDEVKE